MRALPAQTRLSAAERRAAHTQKHHQAGGGCRHMALEQFTARVGSLGAGSALVADTLLLVVCIDNFAPHATWCSRQPTSTCQAVAATDQAMLLLRCLDCWGGTVSASQVDSLTVWQQGTSGCQAVRLSSCDAVTRSCEAQRHKDSPDRTDRQPVMH